MDKRTKLLKFLDTLILSIVESEDTIKINKTTLADIKTCLQDAQEKIEFLQLNLNSSKKRYNKVDIILNLFLFKTLRWTPINSKNIKFRLIHIQCLVQERI